LSPDTRGAKAALLAFGQSCRELGPVVVTLAALDLRERTGELARADELRDGLTLRVKP